MNRRHGTRGTPELHRTYTMPTEVQDEEGNTIADFSKLEGSTRLELATRVCDELWQEAVEYTAAYGPIVAWILVGVSKHIDKKSKAKATLFQSAVLCNLTTGAGAPFVEGMLAGDPGALSLEYLRQMMTDVADVRRNSVAVLRYGGEPLAHVSGVLSQLGGLFESAAQRAKDVEEDRDKLFEKRIELMEKEMAKEWAKERFRTGLDAFRESLHFLGGVLVDVTMEWNSSRVGIEPLPETIQQCSLELFRSATYYQAQATSKEFASDFIGMCKAASVAEIELDAVATWESCAELLSKHLPKWLAAGTRRQRLVVSRVRSRMIILRGSGANFVEPPWAGG